MDPPQIRPPDVGWLRQAGQRVLTLWPAKMIGTTFGMTVFFAAYFWLLRHPLHPPTTMPLTAVDRLVGFWPGAMPLYISLWFYVSLAPALLADRRELISYGLAAIGLSVIGLGLFFFWPTSVPPSDVDWSQHPAFGFLKSVDASGNACPSLHVAFAVFTAVWFARLLRRMGAGRTVRAFNWLWCLGILYSTVATRQHVAVDVLAGAVLGATVAVVHLRLLRALPGPHQMAPISAIKH
jgi:membrane-associated phospholipid phosphatase